MVEFPGAMPLAAMALSVVLSFAIALLYVALRTAQPKSREFAQTLALAGIVSSLIVLAINDNGARGIGLVVALMMVMRFRGNITDPRDVAFATAASAVGVAAGAYAWTVGIGGTLTFVAAALLVSRPWFAPANCLKALTLTVGPEAADQDAVVVTLRHYCDTLALVRVRQVSPFVQEHAYYVQLKRARDGPVLVEAMKQVVRVEDATLVVLDTPATGQLTQSQEP